jgi:hypothetical protein
LSDRFAAASPDLLRTICQAMDWGRRAQPKPRSKLQARGEPLA